MIKIILIFLFLLIQLNFSTAQKAEFVGNIVYQNKFYSPDLQDITPQLSPILGAFQNYSINPNNYKSIMNGGVIVSQFYIGKTNKYYVVKADKTAQELDAAIATDSILKITHGNLDTLISGRICKKLAILTTESNTIYFYDPNLKVNKTNFKNHNFGNWNRYLQESNGALPINYIFESKMFIWESQAIKIEPKILTDQDFELNDDWKIIK
jgi:hypothetical protein